MSSGRLRVNWVGRITLRYLGTGEYFVEFFHQFLEPGSESLDFNRGFFELMKWSSYWSGPMGPLDEFDPGRSLWSWISNKTLESSRSGVAVI
jgi:hypothetical protein